MTEWVGLGDADATPRWLGVTRHQLVLAALALGLGASGVLAHPTRWPVIVVALAAALAALPGAEGSSLGEWGVIALRYRRRARVRRSDEPTVALGCLTQRGRLDLNEDDVALATSVARELDAVALREGTHHVSLHVVDGAHGRATYAAWPFADAIRPPFVAVPTTALDRERGSGAATLERWSYLRDAQGVATLLRVRDFSSAVPGRALLTRLQQTLRPLDLSVHFDVEGAPRATHHAGRAVHRDASNAAVARAAGFRHSALAQRHDTRVAQREHLVANGRALVGVGVYLRVRAADVGALRTAVRAAEEAARAGGVRLERGRGRQAPWLVRHRPGGGS